MMSTTYRAKNEDQRAPHSPSNHDLLHLAFPDEELHPAQKDQIVTVQSYITNTDNHQK